jgi:hypothetical protein
MSSSMQQQLEWRRARVMELMSKGESNQSEIARILQVDRLIVCRDVAYLRQQAKEDIARYVDTWTLQIVRNELLTSKLESKKARI